MGGRRIPSRIRISASCDSHNVLSHKLTLHQNFVAFPQVLVPPPNSREEWQQMVAVGFPAHFSATPGVVVTTAFRSTDDDAPDFVFASATFDVTPQGFSLFVERVDAWASWKGTTVVANWIGAAGGPQARLALLWACQTLVLFFNFEWMLTRSASGGLWPRSCGSCPCLTNPPCCNDSLGALLTAQRAERAGGGAAAAQDGVGEPRPPGLRHHLRQPPGRAGHAALQRPSRRQGLRRVALGGAARPGLTGGWDPFSDLVESLNISTGSRGCPLLSSAVGVCPSLI
jgi:hypothetical protein